MSLAYPSVPINIFSGFKLLNFVSVILYLLSVQNVVRVEVLKCEKDVCGVEFSCIFLESSDLGEVIEKLASRAIFENEEELAF